MMDPNADYPPPVQNAPSVDNRIVVNVATLTIGAAARNPNYRGSRV